MTAAFAGTGALVRLALRRDRIVLACWLLALTIIPAATAISFARLYPTPEMRTELAISVAANPALIAMIGRLVAPDSVGGLVAWRIGGFLALLAGIMALLTVTRHARAEEEAGRLELIRAGAVGYHAPLGAALIVAGGATVMLALLVAVGLLAALPPAGSFAIGSGVAISGLVLCGLSGIASQLATSARGANAIGATAVGLFYLLRAAGDAFEGQAMGFLSWLSPIGWAQQLRPFAGERWWVVGLGVAAAAVLAAVAFGLSQRRDLGAGLLPPRFGSATGSPRLASPLGLAWRLHGGRLLGWTIGFAAIGAVVGVLGHDIGDLFGANPQIAEIIERLGGRAIVIDAYFAATFGLLGVMAGAFAIQAALSLRAEELNGRAEPILATATGRSRWALSHLVFAAVGPPVLLAAAAATAMVGIALRGDDAATFNLPLAALLQVPAVWVLGAIVAALFGLAPRQVQASWVALAACLLVGQLGRILRLPEWVIGLSPFTHTTAPPGGAVAPAALLALTGLAALLIAVGLTGFRRRDLA